MVDDRLEKAGFAFEVVVERGLGKVNGIKDLLDAGSGVTFSGKERDCGVEDLFAWRIGVRAGEGNGISGHKVLPNGRYAAEIRQENGCQFKENETGWTSWNSQLSRIGLR